MVRKGRESRGKKTNKRTLILCEGKVEKLYFQMLKEKYSKSNVNVSILAQAMQGPNLVNKAINKSSKYEEIYVVFDKDDQTNNQLSQALALAKSNNIKVLLTTKQFEYWLLLHFENFKGPNDKKKLESRLCHHTGASKWKIYKSDEFNKLENFFIDSIQTACKNAVDSQFKDINKNRRDLFENPYTNINYYLQEIFNVKTL